MLPTVEASCVKRSRTNTSLQSLGLLNETQRIEMGRALAARLMRERSDDAERLDRLFELLACRPPTPTERVACSKLVRTMRDRYEDAEAEALALLACGEAPRDVSLAAAEHAAWTQLAVTVLASDVAIMFVLRLGRLKVRGAAARRVGRFCKLLNYLYAIE